jgi:D-glycero-alpha-D-manno-heptose-7-phosphate kinase
MPGEVRRQLSDNLLLFYTGIHRSASAILKKTEERKEANHESKVAMRTLSFNLADALHTGKNPLSAFGDFLHKGWEAKKQLSCDISNSHIDDLYQTALKHGARGGKILGAGGGGFLCLYVPKKSHKDVRKSLKNLQELPFDFEYQGSKIIYVE